MALQLTIKECESTCRVGRYVPVRGRVELNREQGRTTDKRGICGANGVDGGVMSSKELCLNKPTLKERKVLENTKSA